MSTRKPNALGKKLKVTTKEIEAVEKKEKELTDAAMGFMLSGEIGLMKQTLKDRDCQTAWLKAYTR